MGNYVSRTSALCASLVLSMARFSSCAVLPFLRGLPLINNAFTIFVVIELFLLRFRIFDLRLNMLTLGIIQTSLFLPSLTRIFRLDYFV